MAVSTRTKSAAARRPRRDAEQVHDVYLRRNTGLIRRAGIRRILAGRYHANGIRTLEQLQEELRQATGIEAHQMTLSNDLRVMGAMKVRDVERPGIEWWVVPAYNPNTEDLREAMDPDVIEGEVAHKIASHVHDITAVDQFIYVMTEARAGHLVGYWISWLPWPEIVYVQEQLDGCIIHCLNGQAALNVLAGLTGDRRHEEVSDAEGEEG